MHTNKPNSQALRNGRVSLNNQVYLVTFVTENREYRFADFRCARLMTRCLMHSKHTKTLAFVVMPESEHIMIDGISYGA